MKTIGIFFGSTTGTTEHIANIIAEKLGIKPSDVHDVTRTAPSEVGDYDLLILGASTWGDGDMQDDMHDFIDGISALDLKGKQIAIFGCGDETMDHTFCNAVGQIYRDITPTGARIIGAFDTDGYSFSHSDAVIDGQAVGLLIDNVNHENLTEERIDRWTKLLRDEL